MKRVALLLASLIMIISYTAHAAVQEDVCVTLIDGKPDDLSGTRDAEIGAQIKPDIDGMVNAIINTRNPDTKLSASHWGHPGYENLAFLYDKAVDALALKAAGHQKEAEDILDYINGRLSIPLSEAVRGADTNNIYGIIKLLNSDGKILKSPINSINISSNRRQGSGVLEFWTTPGPLAFLIFSMLAVNEEKYKETSIQLGEALASMQDSSGGVRDGDRAIDKVHTEPHMDAFSAFLMLYQVTGDSVWKTRADNAYRWFEKNVYHPKDGIIDQGLWAGRRSDIFAEDAYAWTMAGPAGDRIPVAILKRLTDTMLKNSLSRITLLLPDGSTRTVTLVDFSDPDDQRVISARGGFHPMGSVEWTGGAVLALQKNAVRLWDSGDKAAARHYKAMAEYLFAQSMKCFYKVDDIDGVMTFYATGQGYEVAPFGSVRSGFSEGWVTPSFLAKTADGEKVIQGGSSVGIWPLLPYLGVNPFILRDGYKKIYDKIPVSGKDRVAAFQFIDKIAGEHPMNEVMCKRALQPPTQIIEPVVFVKEMWRAIVNAEQGRRCEGEKNCYETAIKWASKVVSDPTWVKLAKRDNAFKDTEFHGLINYKWGQGYIENSHPAHRAIFRYPLLNEMGCAMWGLATANFELGNFDSAKYWMGRIIDDVPLHQIAVIREGFDAPGEHTIIGFWNAIVSWETNPDNNPRTGKIAKLYREVLAERGLSSAMPNTVDLIGGDKEPVGSGLALGGHEDR